MQGTDVLCKFNQFWNHAFMAVCGSTIFQYERFDHDIVDTWRVGTTFGFEERAQQVHAAMLVQLQICWLTE